MVMLWGLSWLEMFLLGVVLLQLMWLSSLVTAVVDGWYPDVGYPWFSCLQEWVFTLERQHDDRGTLLSVISLWREETLQPSGELACGFWF